jgi:hypothetical protein
MSKSSRRLLYGFLIVTGIIVLILHLDALDYVVTDRTFEELAPLIYLPLIILFFVMMLVSTYRRGRK